MELESDCVVFKNMKESGPIFYGLSLVRGKVNINLGIKDMRCN